MIPIGKVNGKAVRSRVQARIKSSSQLTLLLSLVPCRPIVQFVVAGADRELSLDLGLSLVTAAELGSALIKSILVWAAPGRLMVRMRHDGGK